MSFGGMNPLAIGLAALAAFAFGLLYYRLLQPASIARGGGVPAIPLATLLVADALAAWVLAGTLGHLGAGQVTLRNGLICAGFVWAGFAAPALAFSLRARNAGWRPVAVDAAHWLLALMLMGAVIGGTGVGNLPSPV